MRQSTALLYLSIILSAPHNLFAFSSIPSFSHPLQTASSSSTTRPSTQLYSTAEKTSKSKYESKKKGMVKVLFTAKKELSSPPISLPPLSSQTPPTTTTILKDFFLSSQTRNLILSKEVDGVQIITDIPPNSRLLQLWNQQSEGYDIDPNMDLSNDDSCEVLEVITRTQFPGMVLKAINIIGSKRILPSSNNNVPEELTGLVNAQYQLTLLDSKLEPEGNSPIDRLFRKLVGKDASNDKPVEEPRGSSFTTFTLELLDNNTKNGEDTQIQFTSNAKLSVRVEFPRLLIKLLPVSLEKMEVQGSKSMQSTIDKEVGPALERYVEALMAKMKKE